MARAKEGSRPVQFSGKALTCLTEAAAIADLDIGTFARLLAQYKAVSFARQLVGIRAEPVHAASNVTTPSSDHVLPGHDHVLPSHDHVVMTGHDQSLLNTKEAMSDLNESSQEVFVTAEW
ncbi:MAG: hypothetical protein F6K58_19930 [Symploca sp. SIO2E9]|nr:hypothetical protein [Symploca sp. SIO2E9]